MQIYTDEVVTEDWDWQIISGSEVLLEISMKYIIEKIFKANAPFLIKLYTFYSKIYYVFFASWSQTIIELLLKLECI